MLAFLVSDEVLDRAPRFSAIQVPCYALSVSMYGESVRMLLGDQLAQNLEARVAITIQQSSVQGFLSQIMGSAGAFSFDPPHPIWGNASPSQIADVQLGAMGIGL